MRRRREALGDGRPSGAGSDVRDPRRVTVFLAGAVTALVAVAAFLLLSGGSEPAKRHGAAAAHGPVAGVRVRRTKLGPILTDGQGRTLYLFEEDKDGHSQCFGACARVWPPALTTSATPVAGAGLSA
ncbi:MAG: hypothetical protein QOF04_3220, partial [Solirubrobacteraceae bacterium]|nr:hypothetical protein [Solirubrobacteraceae bacterium]